MPLSQTLPGTQHTDLVTFTIKANGEVVGSRYQVASISVFKEVNRVPLATLAIYDGDPAAQNFSISNEETFVPGAEIEINAGYHLDETLLFKGIIVRHSLKIRNDRSPMLILECRDKAVKMTVARKNKYFYDRKDSDIAEEIIGAYQLDIEIQATSVQHKAIVQYDCTDWDFIISRMEANGKLCLIDDGKVSIKQPNFTAEPKLDTVFGATVLEFDAGIDARYQYKSLKAKSWDYSSQAVTTSDAEEPGVEENGNLSATELGDVLGVDEYDLFSGEPVAEDELKAFADARLQKARMSRCRGRVRFRGYGDVKPGDLINIGGVGERFTGKVFVSGLRHDITNGSWKTDIQFGLSNELFPQKPEIHSPPAANMLPAVQGLQIGIVTDLEGDPDSQFRVRVRLPVISADEEGAWARIGSLDAGNNRGMFFRPEIGDEVIVGFFNSDPRNPVILGMLNSSAKPAPLSPSNQNDEKGFVSRSSMKMVFNDADKSLKVETPSGKKITLSESDNIIKIEDEIGNKISMETSEVTIESAGNMTLKARGNLSVEAVNITLTPSANFSLSAGGASLSAGNASASLSATSVSVEGSGTATIKGGIVMIN